MDKFEQFKEQYFDQGYVLTTIPFELTSRFWKEIYTTEWKESKSSYKEIPGWYAENTRYINITQHDSRLDIEHELNNTNYNQCPNSIKQLANEIANLGMFEYLKVFRNEINIKYIHVWNGTDADVDYHQDLSDGSNILVLCYFTDEGEWDESWGGSITVSKQIAGSIVAEKKILPNNGTMLIINNDNPLFMHKVEKMHDDKNRYTFAFSYSWGI